MKLLVTPDTVTSVSTISKLWCNEVFECFVLEPPVPIPAGVFDIKLEYSERFGRIMPFLQNVPGHTAIEIHYGNTVANTKDCLLVGQVKGENFVGNSGPAFTALFAKLEKEASNSIEIRRQVAVPVIVPTVFAVPVPQPQKGITMSAGWQKVESFFNSARGHAFVAAALAIAAQALPQYAAILNQASITFGYGAVVAGAAAPKV